MESNLPILTEHVRRILDENIMLYTLLQAWPSWEYIRYSPNGSDTYGIISNWCDVEGTSTIKTKLQPYREGVRMTYNGILFDDATKSFVRSDHEGWMISLDFSAVFPKGIAEYIRLDENEQFVYESIFPTEVLDTLEKARAIGPRILVRSDLVRSAKC